MYQVTFYKHVGFQTEFIEDWVVKHSRKRQVASKPQYCNFTYHLFYDFFFYFMDVESVQICFTLISPGCTYSILFLSTLIPLKRLFAILFFSVKRFSTFYMCTFFILK